MKASDAQVQGIGVNIHEQKFSDLLDAIAAKNPVPGGGAVASITAALAAALARMVVNYSVGKKSLAAHDELHKAALLRLQELGQRAVALADDDARAYAAMNEIWKLGADDPRRQRNLPKAVERAIHPPDAMLTTSTEMLETLHGLLGATNAHLKSDLAISAILAEAAGRAAAWNILINVPMLTDSQRKAQITRETDLRLKASRTLCGAIEQACRANP